MITGCATTTRTELTDIDDGSCVSRIPDKITIEDITWYDIDGQWVALTVEDYEKLARNTARINRYINQSNQIIVGCYFM